ncbi:MAG: preprotein translocase subunit SecA [Candidatus Marinimicrobia bacterium]|nr:preprotein translocase subunit SecA [Candidatus Neomarinimicrobiota bacterium]|tara:strand:+ start:8867 stop:11917 length:3051 start_codon:yes stop_codon:yes gene_type:complete
MSIFSNIITKVFGRKSDKDLKALAPLVDEINEEYSNLQSLSDEDLKNKFSDIRNELKDTIALKKESYLKEGLDLNEIDDLLYEIEKKFLDDKLIEVFAIIKDASRRLCGTKYLVMNQETVWNMIHYDVQLIGGIALHQGKIAEMKTGEGKTLVSTLAIILNAITGRGIHIITVNDYLAERDSQWMGLLYEFLGLSVGCILNQMSSEQRKIMYSKDITYGTNSQFGFDYLRDNMAVRVDDQVQRGHVFAIVDEVDSVLIDEARTPLIISGVVNNQNNEQYTSWKAKIESLIKKQNQIINNILSGVEDNIETDSMKVGEAILAASRGGPKNRKLQKLFQIQGVKRLLSKAESEFIREKKMSEIDEQLFFSIDERSNVVDLSEKGRNFLSSNNDDFVIPDLGEIYHNLDNGSLSAKDIAMEKEKAQANHSEVSERIHTINQLLRAYSLFEKDVEYIVQDGKVLIVDQHTGRVMHGRQFSDGMHQAIEAKEGVAIQRETQTVATITIQNYFRMYEKLAGMTGTALTEAGEFMEIYKLDVIEIPTNQQILRQDHEDLIYKTKREKYNAVIEKIEELHAKGQPVLVGTTSVEESETLARMLRRTKLPHNVLNAKQHQSEAEIVARAGHKNAITISTNMAGRGTDIKLGDGVIELGGLYILGTGRHESRRIDLQLRGRSGRQGDSGESIFFLSLEDNLMRLFGSDRIAKVMDRLGIQEGEVITHSMVTKSIERAQKKIEAMNFGGRKNIIEYDDVMNYQRDIVYNRRNFALHEKDISKELTQIINEYLEDLVSLHCVGNINNWDTQSLNEDVLNILGIDIDSTKIGTTQQQIVSKLSKQANDIINFKKENFDEKLVDNFQKFIMLRTIDEKWQDHLYTMDQLREGIGLRAYGQKNPLIEYKNEGFAMFEEMMTQTNEETLKRIFRTDLSNLVSTDMRIEQKTKNLETKKNLNVLSSMQQAQSANQPTGAAQPFAPNQKRQPIKVDKKIGRNDKVIIKKGSETKSVKYKKFEKMKEDGWVLEKS